MYKLNRSLDGVDLGEYLIVICLLVLVFIQNDVFE